MQKNNAFKLKQNTQKTIILLIVLAFLYAVFYVVISYVPYFSEKQTFIIVSDSMQPTINKGDLVVANTNFNIAELKVDDIIVFYEDLNNDGTNEIVVHYVAQITEDEGNYTLKTKREHVENYANWDNWELTEDNIIGVYLFHMPMLGSLSLFLSSTFGKIIIIIDIVVILWVVEVFTEDDKKKKKPATLDATKTE